MLSSRQRKQFNTNDSFSEWQIESTLRSCNIEIGSQIDSHFLVFCPFHYNTHTPACEVDKSNGMFICFSCGESGSIYDMVMRVTNRNYFEAARLINSKKDNVDIVREIDDAIEKTNDLPEFDMNLINRLHNDLLESDRGREYFYSRNINDESIKSFRLGFSKNQDMVIVPVFDVSNRALGFVARSIEGKSFKNSVGLPKSKVLFNLNKVKRSTIVVVESSFDAIRLNQVGIKAVATLGASVSRTQISLLQSYANSIIVCPDNDEAGQKMVSKVIDGIKHKNIEVVSLTKGKDVGDLTDQEIEKTFNNAGNNLILAV